MIAASILLAFSLAATPLKIDLWNDLPDTVTITSPGGTPAIIPHGKDTSFTLPGDGKSLTVTYKDCDYPFLWPGAADSFVDDATGSVRLFLSDAVELYVVPSDVILNTPPVFLSPHQPPGFPVYPGPKTCKTP